MHVTWNDKERLFGVKKRGREEVQWCRQGQQIMDLNKYILQNMFDYVMIKSIFVFIILK